MMRAKMHYQAGLSLYDTSGIDGAYFPACEGVVIFRKKTRPIHRKGNAVANKMHINPDDLRDPFYIKPIESVLIVRDVSIQSLLSYCRKRKVRLSSKSLHRIVQNDCSMDDCMMKPCGAMMQSIGRASSDYQHEPTERLVSVCEREERKSIDQRVNEKREVGKECYRANPMNGETGIYYWVVYLNHSKHS